MDTVMTTPKHPAGSSSTPWWKVPHMWMVVGGPLIVVIAAVATFVIAVSNPDPVLDKNEFERGLAEARKLEGQARAEPCPACSRRNKRAITQLQVPCQS